MEQLVEDFQGPVDLPYFENKYPQFTQKELVILIESLNGILWSGHVPLRFQFLINLRDFNEEFILAKFDLASDKRIMILIAEIYAFWQSDNQQRLSDELERVVESLEM